MDYKEARKLKKAKIFLDTCFEKKHYDTYHDRDCYKPTVKEMIKWSGEAFVSLEQEEDGKWVCTGHFVRREKKIKFIGETDVEVVVNFVTTLRGEYI